MRADLRSFLRTTFGLRCPACGEGQLFERAHALRSRCSTCGLDLEGRHGAHYGGPIIMGYAVGGLAGLVVFAVLFWRFGYAPWVLWVTLSAAVLAIIATFRYCKAFWAWWLYLTGELRHGEPPQTQAGRPES